MTRATSVHFGYEIGTGDQVAVPLRHMAITGQTQMAGKTTALEALVSRSEMRALAFVTKRAEGAFSTGQTIHPYFRERADWQYVAAILEATLRERMKFERAWIMRASKGARTLAEVQHNVRALMEKSKGMSADVYMTLDAYLDIVVPQISQVTWAPSVDLQPGLNVMQLDQFSPELQSLVIRSVLEWIYEKEHETIVIIPEAWEFIPQNRGSPVKLAAETLIRKGASARNFLWLDSQDIAAVHKDILRSVHVWVMGVQREANEVKRVLSHIPEGVGKPKVSDVMRLDLGQFYVATQKGTVKAYAQPAWLDDESARAIATGEMLVEQVSKPKSAPRVPPRSDAVANPQQKIKQEEDPDVKESEAAELRAENDRLATEIAELRGRIDNVEEKYPKHLARMGWQLEQAVAYFNQGVSAVSMVAAEAKAALEAGGYTNGNHAGAPFVEHNYEIAQEAGTLRHEFETRAAVEQIRRSARVAVEVDPNAPPDAPQQKVLDALATYETLDMPEVGQIEIAAFAGIKRGGYLSTAFRRLIDSGRINDNGGRFSLSPAGRELAHGATVKTRADVHAFWLAKCDPPQRKALEALIELGPDKLIEKQQLSDHIGIKQGGYLSTALKRLEQMGAVNVRGTRIGVSHLLYPPKLKK